MPGTLRSDDMKIQTKDFSMPVVDSRPIMGLGWSTKLVGGHSPYGLDIDFGDQGPAINESEMSVTFPFASGVRRDSVGDLLEIGGIDTSRHIRNPVVLFEAMHLINSTWPEAAHINPVVPL